MTDAPTAKTIISYWDTDALAFYTKLLDYANRQVGETLISITPAEAGCDVRWLMSEHPLTPLDVSRVVAQQLDHARIIYVEV